MTPLSHEIEKGNQAEKSGYRDLIALQFLLGTPGALDVALMKAEIDQHLAAPLTIDSDSV